MHALERAGINAADEVHIQNQAPALGALDSVSEELLAAVTDEHPNVRRAAVQALARWTSDPRVAERLRSRRTYTDSDVRAYARLALRG